MIIFPPSLFCFFSLQEDNFFCHLFFLEIWAFRTLSEVFIVFLKLTIGNFIERLSLMHFMGMEENASVRKPNVWKKLIFECKEDIKNRNKGHWKNSNRFLKMQWGPCIRHLGRLNSGHSAMRPGGTFYLSCQTWEQQNWSESYLDSKILI